MGTESVKDISPLKQRDCDSVPSSVQMRHPRSRTDERPCLPTSKTRLPLTESIPPGRSPEPTTLITSTVQPYTTLYFSVHRSSLFRLLWETSLPLPSPVHLLQLARVVAASSYSTRSVYHTFKDAASSNQRVDSTSGLESIISASQKGFQNSTFGTLHCYKRWHIPTPG